MKIRLVGAKLFHADGHDERAEKSHGVKCPSIPDGKEGCLEWGVVVAE